MAQSLSFLSLFKPPINVRVIADEPRRFLGPDGWIEQSVWNFSLAQPAQIIGIIETFDGWGHIYFCPQTTKEEKNASSESITHINDLALDLDSNLAKADLTPASILQHCKKLLLPYPTVIISTGGGYHAHWILKEPLYIGKRRHEEPKIYYKRKEQLLSWFNEIITNLVTAFKELGADPKAKDLPHIFRVPGAINPKYGCPVELVHLNLKLKARSSLGELSDRVRFALRRFERKDEDEDKDSATQDNTPAPAQTPTPIPILDTSGFNWLKTSSFCQGNRNHAFFALAVSLKLAGIPYPAAWAELTKWRKERTIPTYPEREAFRVLRCIYKMQYGLSYQELHNIQNSCGQTMPPSKAFEIIKAMPKAVCKQGQRKNFPRVVSLLKILEALFKYNVFQDTPLSAKELSKLANITEDQVEHVADFLTKLKIRYMKRINSSFIAVYNLKRAHKGSLPQVIIKFAEWMSAEGAKLPIKVILKWWWRVVRRLLKRLWGVCRAILNRINASLRGESSQKRCLTQFERSWELGIRGPPERRILKAGEGKFLELV